MPAGRQGRGDSELDALRARVAELEDELTRAEKDGAELAAGLARAGQAKQEPCWPCEVKRRWLAVCIGLPLGWALFSGMVLLDRSLGLPPSPTIVRALFGIWVGATPLGSVVLDWKWEQFKRKYSWVSLTDNDLYRAAAEKWNGWLSALHLQP